MLSGRTYEGSADLQPMIELLVAVRPPESVADWPGVVELLWFSREVGGQSHHEP